MRRALFFLICLAAPSAFAQTAITVNSASTFQTWRWYGSQDPVTQLDDNKCTVISAAEMNQALPYLADEGVTQARIQIHPRYGLESTANDNTDPFSQNHTGTNGFDAYYSVAGTIPGSSCTDTLQGHFNNVKLFRNAVTTYGQTPLSSITMIRYCVVNSSCGTGLTVMPAYWYNGTGSTGNGVDEATEADQATLDYIYTNYGYCVDYVKFNEPDNSTNGYVTASGVGAASWLPGVVNSWVSRVKNDTNCKGTKFMGPEDANMNNVLSDLSTNFGAVSGSEANLAYITYHPYTVAGDSGAAIYTHANGNGQQVAATEFFCSGDKSYTNSMNCWLTDVMPLVKLGNISGWDWNSMWGPCYTETVQGSCDNIGGADIGIGWGKAASSGGTSPGFYLEPSYWIQRQYVKYGMVPGNVRISSTSADDTKVSAVAWKRSDGTTVVTVWNVGGGNQTFSIGGLNNLQYHIHKLDPTLCNTSLGLSGGVSARCTPSDSATITPSAGSTGTLTLPTQGIWTFTQDQPIAVTVAPSSATVPVSTTAQFTATVVNDAANAGVTWALSGSTCSGPTCGTLSSTSSLSGVAITYTAPASTPTVPMVTLTATSVTDGTKNATASITVSTLATGGDPLALEYEPSLDCTAGDYPNPTTVKLDISQFKLRSDEAYSDLTTGKVCIDLAGTQNEFVDFQVHVNGTGLSGVTNLSATLGDLTKTTGPGGNFTIHTSSTTDGLIYREGYINLTSTSCTSGSNNNCANFIGATGHYPDYLIPATDPYYSQTTNAFPFTVSSSANQSLWVDIHIPATAVSGWYSGTITITGNGGTLGAYPIRLAVWQWPAAQGSKMPSTSSIKNYSGLGVNTGMCFIWGITSSCTGYPGTYTGAIEDAYTLFLDHRWAISAPNVDNIFVNTGSFTSWDSAYAWSLNGTAGQVTGILSGAKRTTVNIDCNLSGSPLTCTTASSYQNWSTHFNTTNTWPGLMWYRCDEASCTWTQWISQGTTVHGAASPVVPVLMTKKIAEATANNGLNAADWMVTEITDLYGTNAQPPLPNPPGAGVSTRANYNSWLTGTSCVGCPTRLIGNYNDDIQGATGPDSFQSNYFVDGLPAAHRAMMWANFYYGVNIEIYYQVDRSSCNGCNPFGADLFQAGAWGDGTLEYPCSKTSCGTATNPIYLPSIRLKIMRDGEEDYEYLNALKTAGKSGYVNQQIALWLTDGNRFNTNTTAPAGAYTGDLFDVRNSLGTTLHELTYQGAPGRLPRL